MRYIMFEDFSGKEVPIIFPARIGFVEMREQMPYATVVSAGYIQLRSGEIFCHGEAKELGAVSKETDNAVVTEYLTDIS
ncbi:MAG: hypothetical protein ACNI27_00445 [Desulfovibrio sp.]